MENLYLRATLSTLESNYRRGIFGPLLFLELERKAKNILKAGEYYSRNDYMKLLKSGIPISFLGLNFVAQISEPNQKLTGIKKLSRLKEKTKSPKRGRKTVFRRNSTVIERSRQPKNWRSGQQSVEQRLMKQKVNFTPLNQWLKKQSENKLLLKKLERKRIAVKRSARVAEAILQWETNTNNEIVANFLLRKINNMSEKKGVCNPDEMKRRLENNLDRNVPQPIVFIWGPPYENQGKNKNSFEKGKPEFFMMQDIKNALKFLKDSGLQINPILIYADFYGIEINGIPQNEVRNYFEEIKRVSSNSFIVTSISEIFRQNNIFNLYSSENVAPTIEEIRAAKKTQLKLGRGISYQKAVDLATNYKVARLNEGRLLTGSFYLNGQKIQDVIKLATARNKEKDNPYELGLPRFYVSGMTRTAWNMPRR